MVWQIEDIFDRDKLPDAQSLIAEGRSMARSCQLVPGAFLKSTGYASEAAYKRAMARQGRIMRHAHMGFRDFTASCRAYGEIYDKCAARDARIDRIGITLDWSMGVVRSKRKDQMRGTGLVLSSREEFAGLTRNAPAAPHFGDFVLGFPASIENTQGALAAGSTSIGNLGQYFTFRLPGHADDIEASSATLTALALIAAQDVDVLVHSNLDDGFAAVFTDMSSVLGAALVEKYIVEELIGAPLAHCYGHHFTCPMRRMAFHFALDEVSSAPGTMVYGNTVSYRGTAAENYAALAHYLIVDIAAQLMNPTGHAVNPVPVSENERIPDSDEIIDAHCFAAQLIDHASGLVALVDPTPAREMARQIVDGGKCFKSNLLRGFENGGIDIQNPFDLLLALRRIGGKKLEELYGAGPKDQNELHGRRALVVSPLVEELDEICTSHLARVSKQDRAALKEKNLRVLVAATDVHEHAKLVLDKALEELAVTVIDGGVSTDADMLARLAATENPDAIAVSTYNGIALTYLDHLLEELARLDLDIPVLIGGRLNQIPESSNTSLPIDVSKKLRARGAIVCGEIEDIVPALLGHDV